MKQILLTCVVFLGLVGIMSISLIFKGRPLRKSCGSLINDDEECLICDNGQDPDKCTD